MQLPLNAIIKINLLSLLTCLSSSSSLTNLPCFVSETESLTGAAPGDVCSVFPFILCDVVRLGVYACKFRFAMEYTLRTRVAAAHAEPPHAYATGKP
jgi:hypothetical protein